MLRTMLLVLLLSTPLGPAAGQAPPPNIVYSSWTKVCETYAGGESVCHTAKFGNTESGRPVVAAVLTELQGRPQAILRVVLPSYGMMIQPGARVSFDDGQRLTAPYIACFSKGCMADIEASAKLIGKMKGGRTLALQGLDSKAQQASFGVPLADFAKVHDGPPSSDDKLLHELQEQLPRPGQPAGEVSLKDLGQLTYSPWIKLCPTESGGKVCLTARNAWPGQAPGPAVASAVLIDPPDDAKKILRVTLPFGLQMHPGTHLFVDNGRPLTAPYIVCTSNGCMSDYEARAELIGQLKKGTALTVQGIDSQGQTLSPILPLAEFAKAYDGPPADPKLFTDQQRKLQEQLNSGH